MSLTFDSDQPANSSTGMDTTGRQTVSTAEPPQNIRMRPAPRPQDPQSTDLNLDSGASREQRLRRPPKQNNPQTGT